MGGRITRAEEIVRKQEALALRILGRVDNEEAQLDVQLDAFEKIGKWVAIKNKLEDDGAGDINRFKERIQGAPDRHYAPSRRPKGWTPPDEPKPRLEALRARLPHGRSGGVDGDSGDTGDEASTAA